MNQYDKVWIPFRNQDSSFAKLYRSSPAVLDACNHYIEEHGVNIGYNVDQPPKRKTVTFGDVYDSVNECVAHNIPTRLTHLKLLSIGYSGDALGVHCEIRTDVDNSNLFIPKDVVLHGMVPILKNKDMIVTDKILAYSYPVMAVLVDEWN